MKMNRVIGELWRRFEGAQVGVGRAFWVEDALGKLESPHVDCYEVHEARAELGLVSGGEVLLGVELVKVKAALHAALHTDLLGK
jgi:hypothetical protein